MPCTQLSQSGWGTERTTLRTNARLRGYSGQLTYQCGLKSCFGCVESFPIENSKMIKSHFLAIFRLSWQIRFFTLKYLFSRRVTYANQQWCRFKVHIILPIVKVCPHLYANANEACGTNTESSLFGVCLLKHTSSVANIFFFEVPTPNR